MLQFVNPLKTCVMIFSFNRIFTMYMYCYVLFFTDDYIFLLFFIFVSLPLFDRMAQTKHLVFRAENDLFPRKADTTWVI